MVRPFLFDSYRAAAICVSFAATLLSSIHGRVQANEVRESKKSYFTIADEIGLTLFGGPNGGAPEVHFSPDGNYVAVWSERGHLDQNLVEDSLRFYRTQDIAHFVERSGQPQPPPVWVVERLDREGPVINEWRWLADSSGVAFLQGAGDFGDKRLVLADLRKRAIEPLTAQTEAVEGFDINDRQHYVYIVAARTERAKMQAEPQAPAIVGTGRSLYELLLPDDPVTIRLFSQSDKSLWAVIDAKRFEVKLDGAPINPDGLALSPDGHSLVTKVPVSIVPRSWETLYLPPFASDPRRLRAGSTAHKYVRIGLQTASVQDLTEAPVAEDADWWAALWARGRASWSSNGKAVLLPGTFLKSNDGNSSRPCVAVVDLSDRSQTCVEVLKGGTGTGALAEGFHVIVSARFRGGDERQVTVRFGSPDDTSVGGASEYRRTSDGSWELIGQSRGEPEIGREGLEMTVEQQLDKPPVLVATRENESRVVWDPNPQLKNVDLGQADVYAWKDIQGHEWKAGLYKPSNYKAGQHYPLVIQTHGFNPSEFRPSGVFPTAFAARALAAAGIFVLQTGDVGECPGETPDEGPCNASGYEAVAKQLVSEGLVDPSRVGIIGFSRTVFYVMETLTRGSLHLAAASISDGVTFDYWQYIADPNRAQEYNSVIGAAPFGEGLKLWLERSPGFNLEKVGTPLLINTGEGVWGTLNMWQPYAALRGLKKPVELVKLNTNEHVLTNPAVRMASQGGSVDWFRFWLQGYEDPKPEKAKQYRRWEHLCDLQISENPNQSASCARTATH